MFFESGMAGSCASALVEAPIDHHSAAAAGEGAGVVLCCCCNFFATRISQSGGALGSAPETRPTQLDSIFSLLHHHFLSCTLGGRSPSFRLAATSFPHPAQVTDPATRERSASPPPSPTTHSISSRQLGCTSELAVRPSSALDAFVSISSDLVTFIDRRV